MSNIMKCFQIFVMLIIFSVGACKTNSPQLAEDNTPQIGFRVKQEVKSRADTKFMDSKYLRKTDMLDFPAISPPHKRKDVLIVRPNLPYSSWRDLLFKNKNIRYFLITPGNYQKWGDLRPISSGTAQQPYIFRYYDPESAKPYEPPHPVKLKLKGKEAVLERFNFIGISHWVLHGLTFRGQAEVKQEKRGGLYNCFRQQSDHNIVDYCLLEGVLWGNFIRINNSNYNSIQRCVIRDKIEGFRGDNIGVSVHATVGKKSIDNRIVDNEIYNVTDAVQFIYQVNMGKNHPMTGEVPGTIVDNNDMYITKQLHRYKDGEELACAENGIDIKVGTSSTEESDRVRLTNNRIWGYRKTDKTCSGESNGTAIGLHVNASNILIENNIIFDVPRGIGIAGKNNQFPEGNVGNNMVRNNIFYNINATADNSGYAFVVYSDNSFVQNTVKNAKHFLIIPNDMPSVFKNNLFIDVEQDAPKEARLQCSFQQNHWIGDKKATLKKGEQRISGKNNYTYPIAKQTDFKDFIFYIKRWTKPERIVIPKVLNK